MRIGRNRRLHLPWYLRNPVMRIGVFAAGALSLLTPALAQDSPGAVAVATFAAAAATVSAPAPAPKKSAASAATDASAMGNSELAPAQNANSDSPGTAELAANAAAPDGAAQAGATADPGPPLTGVAAQCADLLKMATSLKAEVAKTTKDVLSIPVIRDAGQIEEMAKKMREAQH